jgi:hypothetical protein
MCQFKKHFYKMNVGHVLQTKKCVQREIIIFGVDCIVGRIIKWMFLFLYHMTFFIVNIGFDHFLTCFNIYSS